MLRILPAIVVLLTGTLAAVSQQTAPLTKAQLIGQFAELTNANHIDIKVDLSLDDVSKRMVSMIDGDKDLTDAQRDTLRASAKEIFSRLAAQTQKTLTESQVLVRLGEQVVTDVYSRSFTEAELVELIAFFKTPLGKKAVNFLETSKTSISNDFRAAMGAKIDEVSQPLINSSIAELQQRIKDVKKK